MPGEVIGIDSVDLVYVTGGTRLTALEGITLTADDGEFVAVVGPSGCGKSTLLKIVAGLLPSTTGGVRVNGQLVHGPPPSIGVVFQSPLLMPWRDVVGNVMVQIDMRGLPAHSYRSVAMNLLKVVGLKASNMRTRTSCPEACSNGSDFAGRLFTIPSCC
jgi:NitT/TauT family transport system ATP-binding protein